jgi:hypothetical protein
MRSTLLWNITQRRVVILYCRFGTPMCPIFKAQAIQKEGPFVLDFLTLKDGADRFSRNVDTELPLYAA